MTNDYACNMASSQEELSSVRAAASRPLAPPDLTHGSRPDITGGQRQPLDLVPGEEAWHQWQEDFEPQLPGQLDIPDVEQVHAGLQQEGRLREQQEEIARLEEEVRMLQVRVGELSGGNQQLQESLTRTEQERKELQEGSAQLAVNQEQLQNLLLQAENERDETQVKIDVFEQEKQQLLQSLSLMEEEKVQLQDTHSSLIQERDQLVEKETNTSEVVLDLQEKLNKSEDGMRAVEQQVEHLQSIKEQLEAQVAFYQPQVEQLQNQLQFAEQQCQALETRMNETSGFAAAVQQNSSQIKEQLGSRQAAQAQPVDTWAQLAPTGSGSEMQAGGWAPHVWGQPADNSAASFFDQPVQSGGNATAEFFDSPQVQQTQVCKLM